MDIFFIIVSFQEYLSYGNIPKKLSNVWFSNKIVITCLMGVFVSDCSAIANPEKKVITKIRTINIA